MARITLQLDDDVHADLQEYVPHGFRQHVLASVIKLTVDSIKRDGNIMIGALMSNDYKLVRDERQKTD